MNTIPPANDLELLDLLRVEGPMDVTEMANAVGVTATAIRQRLGRLMAEGAIRRRSVREGRGRPKHVYELTERGVRLTGSNFTDLALALWEGICAVDDPEVRETIIRSVAAKLAEKYASEVAGTTPTQRMEALIHLLGQRRVPFRVDKEDGLPVLNAEVCPYPGLADTNRDICRLEMLMLSQLMGHEMDLTECRADGSDSCRFCLSTSSASTDTGGDAGP